MGMILLIFYFLLIRPQQRKQKEHERMIKGVERGDSVVTAGGVHGRVTGVSEDVLTVEIAALKGGDRVRVKVDRSRIDSVMKATKSGEKAQGGES
jgi:preprotein translocase subunit YajC